MLWPVSHVFHFSAAETLHFAAIPSKQSVEESNLPTSFGWPNQHIFFPYLVSQVQI